MAMYKRFAPHLQSAFSVVIMIAIWLALAPRQVGGLASYIIVIGNSMEPNFHIGDLVIVHEQPVYQVGDAIVYQNRQLKKFVFHRIISQQLGSYTLQGDNNSWVDTYQPSPAEVIGRLWLHIPHGGIAVQKIRSPFFMALIAGGLGAILAIRLFGSQTKGKKLMQDKTFQQWFAPRKQKIQGWLAAHRDRKSGPPNLPHPGEVLEGSFFVLGAIALASLILGMLVFSKPASRTVSDDISFQHLGVFSYTASAPQGVYDASSIKSGDPIFTKLTCQVDVNFQYMLIAAQAENIKGTYQLMATLSEPVSGWQRRLPLQEEASFSGTAFGTSARLDLCKFSSMAQSLEQGTDFHPSTYLLTITPGIKVNGNVSDHPLQDTFDAGVTFRYDHLQFYLLREENISPLTLTETATLRRTRREANTLLLLGRELSISGLRWVALLSFVTSLVGLILLGVRLERLARCDQERFIQIRHGSLIVDVENADLPESYSRVDVNSIEAMAKLAERFNAMILHRVEGNLHTYDVQSGGTLYRFTLNAGQAASTLSKAEVLHPEGGA